jgi:hypothetical protein
MPTHGKSRLAIFSGLLRIPDGLCTTEVTFSLILVPAVLLLLPEEEIGQSNVGFWALLATFIGSFAAGLISAYLVRRRAEPTKDPFYLRAWWAFIGGAAALPLCLIFRSAALPLAAACFLFGLGPILGNRTYRCLRCY